MKGDQTGATQTCFSIQSNAVSTTATCSAAESHPPSRLHARAPQPPLNTAVPPHVEIRSSVAQPLQSFSIPQFATAKTTTVVPLPHVSSCAARPLQQPLPRDSQQRRLTTVPRLFSRFAALPINLFC
ncbi:hypothetical protein HN51_038571 [Arachis hypogaea]